MEQTAHEARNQLAAQLLLWLDEYTGDMNLSSKELTRFGEQTQYYSNDVGQIVRLCGYVKASKHQKIEALVQERFLDPMARKLLGWIEDHEESDRRKAEAGKVQDRQKKESDLVDAVKTLTDKQLDSIISALKG
jgi:hypothetical protein